MLDSLKNSRECKGLNILTLLHLKITLKTLVMSDE